MLQVVSAVTLLLLAVAHEARAACSDEPLWQALVARARTIAEEACSCDTATSNASYVTCVEASLSATVSQGLLPESCRATVVNAATASTCGTADAVACCTPGSGGGTCAVVPAAQCGGTSYAGISESCYDACTSAPRCADIPAAGDETAMNAAYDHIKTAYPNVVTDENLFRLMYHQAAVEQGCWQSHRMKNFRSSGGSGGGFAPQSASNSKPRQDTSAIEFLLSTSMGPCPDYDCLPTYEDDDTYCGPGANNFLTTNCDSPCLNRACYRHDGCTREHCTSNGCLFAAAGDCDSCFHGQCGACRDAYEAGGVDESEKDAYTCTRRVCWAATKIGAVTESDGCSEDPDYCACDGENCEDCRYCDGCAAGGGVGACSLISESTTSNVMHSAKVMKSSFTCLDAVQAGCGGMAEDCSASARAIVRYYNCAGKWRDTCSGTYDSNLTCDTPCDAGPCSESLARNAAWEDQRLCAESKGFPLIGGTPPVSPPHIWLRRTGACCLPPP